MYFGWGFYISFFCFLFVRSVQDFDHKLVSSRNEFVSSWADSFDPQYDEREERKPYFGREERREISVSTTNFYSSSNKLLWNLCNHV